MQYVGLHRQISRNNRFSVLLLIAFPTLLLAMLYVIIRVIAIASEDDYPYDTPMDPTTTFLSALPVVLIIVGIWFLIAWWGHAKMIQAATGSRPLDRRENKRVYNLTENLCIQLGIPTPK